VSRKAARSTRPCASAVVAAESRISQAMVIKIARNLGYDGFRLLRAALAEHNRLPLAEIRRELCGCQSTPDIMETVRRLSVRALGHTFSTLSWEGLKRAPQVFCAADQRDLYGLDDARKWRDAAFKFLRIGLRTSVFDDGCMMSMSASLLQQGDLALAFSHSGQNATIRPFVRRGQTARQWSQLPTAPPRSWFGSATSRFG
jgi:DNA-binding MurR/RpiR family transcriptional regulator